MTPYFDGRVATPGAFDKIEHALFDTASAVAASDAPKSIVCEGYVSLPTAGLLGAVFSPLAGFQLKWRQALAGHDAEDWSRAYIYGEPLGGPVHQGVALTPQDGLALALQAVEAVRKLRDQMRLRALEVHIFLACPIAMAMLIGQKLNTFSTCYLYEHAPQLNPPYMQVHSFNPSTFTYHG